MSKKRKLASLFAISSSLLIPSCQNFEANEELKVYIDHSLDYKINKLDPLEEKTKSILYKVLSTIYKDELIKQDFLAKQEDEKYIEETKAQFSKYRDDFEYSFSFAEKQNVISNQELNDFYNKNWYFILNNIKDFEPNFYKFYSFPESIKTGAKHSDEYLEFINDDENKDKVYDKLYKLKPANNFLDESSIGEESIHSKDYFIYYIRKGQLVFRFKANKAKKENDYKGSVEFGPLVLGFPFYKSQSKVSTRLISQIIHSGLIHEDQDGYDRLEKDFERLRYNQMALFFLKWGGN